MYYNQYRYSKGFSELGFLETITISISSIFGMSTYDSDVSNVSAKLSVFIVCLCGSMFFYVYTGFLTSALAIPGDHKPFESPQELLQTSYR